MRHPLDWLLRLAVPKDDRPAVLGDLSEEYERRVRPQRSWLGCPRPPLSITVLGLRTASRRPRYAPAMGGSLQAIRRRTQSTSSFGSGLFESRNA